MKKQDKGVGPYSKVDADSTPQKVPTKSWAQGSKDISKIVDSNSEANGGFPAALKPKRD
jgi:hypothetical protein